jgi:hypothetical protein
VLPLVLSKDLMVIALGRCAVAEPLHCTLLCRLQAQHGSGSSSSSSQTCHAAATAAAAAAPEQDAAVHQKLKTGQYCCLII